ncbi:MAG: hypothetical protein KKC79_04510 [Gammaproteobacteria bacterium]|nr:hypothetical protein [Gammaproteobacteria bacterium]MBU1441546.1 hypothetical protein [Gammaproteobacteria bacterium]MBU2288887.1 hypothetical protein [Gammaproteobacteria bacterium]MBU2407895.1 hypothetical protein [Gammaproteobacteria bacterium]
MSASRPPPVRSARWRRFRDSLIALVLMPLACITGSAQSAQSASSHLSFTVVVPPVFRVLQVVPQKEGLEYRVWTNMRSIVINGHEHAFSRVGEATLRVPRSSRGLFVVHGL